MTQELADLGQGGMFVIERHRKGMARGVKLRRTQILLADALQRSGADRLSSIMVAFREPDRCIICQCAELRTVSSVEIIIEGLCCFLLDNINHLLIALAAHPLDHRTISLSLDMAIAQPGQLRNTSAGRERQRKQGVVALTRKRAAINQ